MPNLSGHTIENGRLKLLNVLGSGAYGVVYRALDTTSPRHAPIFYAVKCLRKSGLDDGHFASQNVEIDLHRKVSGHKNVLTFHRVLQEADFMFIILDLCPGGDMFFAITKHHFYHKNDHRIKAAILQIIDAVSFIHDAQVFHRDLKPENILCGPDGLDIRIADFGLATDTYTGRTSGCGSATHMSPGELYRIPCIIFFFADIFDRGHRRGLLPLCVFDPPQRYLGSRRYSRQSDNGKQRLVYCSPKRSPLCQVL